MANIPVRRPVLLQQPGNMNTQKPPIPQGATPFKGGDLVQIIGGLLVPMPTTANATATTKLCWGITPDDSRAAGAIPPQAFFGDNHYCFSVEDAIIEMSSTNDAGGVGSGAGTGNGTAGPQWSAATLGVMRAITYGVTGYTGIHFVNLQTATAADQITVQVVGVGPNQTVNDYNPRVLVKFPRANLQG